MLAYNRMLQGCQLQYYNPYEVIVPPPFGISRHCLPLYKYSGMAEISEDIIMPESPNSTQSDSDNSMSSIEVRPQQISVPTKASQLSAPSKSAVQCCWKSCGLWVETLDQLAGHITTMHSASGPKGLFYCEWEGCTRNQRGFNARYKMLVHVRTHTNEKPHRCDLCDKSFSRAENLKIHSRSHSGEKPYVCPVPGCNKAYSNSSDRFKHTRTHQVNKPYACKVAGCPKRYTDPSSLRKHVKTYKHFASVIINCDKKAENTEPRTHFENLPREMEQRNNEKYSANAENDKHDSADERFSTPEITSSYQYSNSLSTHVCDCPHSCCVTNCLTKAAELLKLGAFINLRTSEYEKYRWGSLMDKYTHDTSSSYAHYEERSNTPTDFNVPLDLTTGRKY